MTLNEEAPMETTERRSLRVGPISLLTLIIVISLAVMTVLTTTTVQASHAMTTREQTSTTEGYLAETSAQTFLASLDETLGTVRASGTTSRSAALAATTSALPSLIADAQDAADGVTVTAQVTDDGVQATFSTEHGRTLDVEVEIGEDANYDITAWKLTTAQEQTDGGGTLWSGSSND
jgi:hypothetical protein